MLAFPRPVVVISKCLGFDTCRYDGEKIECGFMRELKPYVRFIPVCPEIEIGLGVPRDPVMLVLTKGKKNLFQEATGRDLTSRMRKFSTRFLSSLGEVDGFILKRKSPSCGVRDAKVFAGMKAIDRVVQKSSGIFAEDALNRFPNVAIEDELRLESSRIRHQWLTSLFTLAAFRKSMKRPTIGKLVRFHERNKLLFSVRSLRATLKLERIISSGYGKPIDQVMSAYWDGFYRVLLQPAGRVAETAALEQTYTYFFSHLSRSEKKLFLKSLKQFQAGDLPIVALLKIVWVWGVRYNKEYLKSRSWFQPYPQALTEYDKKLYSR
jgi:uncharacterized protein YbbK (DUF523 family)/uncharacterized protein YbgA (DUF1722 family)